MNDFTRTVYQLHDFYRECLKRRDASAGAESEAFCLLCDQIKSTIMTSVRESAYQELSQTIKAG